MGIWIKSQDGGLGEYIKFLPPVINREEKPDPEVPFCTISGEVLNAQIMGCDMVGRVDVLGTYFTEAEAMQVLDMIQEYIAKGRGQMEDYGDGRTIVSDVVFQMPEAGFSAQSEKEESDFYFTACGEYLSSCGFVNPAKADEIGPYNHCSQIGSCKAAWNRGCR